MIHAVDDSAQHLSLSRLWPGVALSAALAAIGLGLGTVQHWLFGRAWVDALVIAILLGAALNSTRPLPARFQPGIAFSAKFLLEVAVMLSGATISDALADRWQKNALLFGAAQPGNPWATPLTSTTGW